MENVMKQTMQSRRKKRRFTPLSICVFIFLALWSVSMFVCFFWIFNNSLKTGLEYEFDQVAFAKEPLKMFQINYSDVFSELVVKNNSVFRMLWNTVWFTGSNIIGNFVTSLLFAYAIARYKFPGRNAIYWFVIFKGFLPFSASLSAQYKLYDFLGLTDSYLYGVVFLSGLGNFLILYNLFKGMDSGYAEAAFLDGANHFQVFFLIMVPQTVSIVTPLVILSFVSCWNEYMTFVLFLPSMPNLSTGLYYISELKSNDNYPLLLAGIVVSMVPVILVFIIFQKYFINIDISGGIKG